MHDYIAGRVNITSMRGSLLVGFVKASTEDARTRKHNGMLSTPQTSLFLRPFLNLAFFVASSSFS